MKTHRPERAAARDDDARTTQPAPALPPRVLRKATSTAEPSDVHAPQAAATPTSWTFSEAVTAGLIQRAGDGPTGDGADTMVQRAAAGTGHVLPGGLRERFESSLGADLSGVRVHADEPAAAAAAALGARAYAVGQDVFMGAGEYAPDTADGAWLLAHEVAHTVQQASTGGRAPQTKLAVSSPSDPAERDADRAADAMVIGAPAAVSASPPGRVHRYHDAAHARPFHDYVGRANRAQLETIIGQLEQELARHNGNEVFELRIGNLMFVTGPGGGVEGDCAGPFLASDLDELLVTCRRRHGALRAPPPCAPNPGPTSSEGPVAPEPHPSGEGQAANDEARSRVTTRPVTVEPAGPTGAENLVERPQLDAFVRVVRDSVSLWQQYIQRWSGPRPGLLAYDAARRLDHDHPDFAGNPAVHSYLRQQLGPAGVQAVYQMTRFNPGLAAPTLAELFGITSHAELSHRYTLTVNGGQMTIRYRNETGMEYTHTMRQRHLSVGPSAEVRNGVPSAGVGAEALHDGVGEAAPSRIFWEPEWFDTGFTVAGVSAGVSGGGLGVQSEHSAGASMITFHSHGESMRFEIRGTRHETGRGGGLDPHIGGRVEAGVGGGWTSAESTQGRSQVTEAQVPIHRLNATSELMTATLQFETGSADLDAAANAAVRDIVARVNSYLHDHPDSHVGVTITAFTSPRWSGAHGPHADARRRMSNLELANRRSTAVLAQLRNAIAAHGGGDRCDFTVQSCDPIAAEERPPTIVNRPEAAEEHGVATTEDPPEWRSVEVRIERSRYQQGTPTPVRAPSDRR